MSKSNSEGNGLFSLGNLLSFVSENFVLIVIILSFFLGGFFFGSLWTENKMLKTGSGSKPAAPTAVVPGDTAPVPGARDLSIPALVAKGVQVGANESELQKCIDSGEMVEKITNDFNGGQTAGVTGTPGTIIIVNGEPAELIPGALPYAQVKAMIDVYVNGGAIDPVKKAEVANTPAVTSQDHYKGSETAKIVLVEYSDYECPFCQTFHPTMLQILEEYKTDVAWVYRNYPLSFHASAQKAAEAAECVAELEGNDAFWEYSDLLFN